MITIIIAISLLQACSFFEKKIDYEPFVKALDEGDMKKVMSASDDGYAYVKQRGIYSTYEQKEDGEHSKTIYQTSKGIYNTKDKSLYGNTTQEITSKVDNKNYREEVNYSTNISYENGQVQSTDSSLGVSYVNLIVDRLKGIGKLKMKPGDDIKKFGQPSTVGYKLTESEFQSIINDKLKIQYDEYGGGSIALHIEFTKGSEQILEVSIVMNYNKRNEEGKLVEHISQIHTYFDSHQGNNKDAKQEYIDFKAKYNETQ
ncbi:DUF3952 domain-containing protein [Bacillus thuringiensis]|uniref:DUF3952 domain-containing protein n=1 Tax=Bacillus thuringiensis TaxID=1428 RepID=UPI0007C1A072|nr:DUF3952 domain-containing protein [Bacillus thuringiensis]AND07593.1 hypothetical protein Bt4C1_10425 [Bacillus thuringiensis serovar alesti]MEC3598735.1 DUF3952 domain-containing protein [Bacillus thuringiensis]MED1836562.1 DUF3952 domain-containing protein [Bacillus thuringiensis]MED2210563.1 DUF3952 domain-containing protein [Bacillus thuringiensis]MED2668427.1 DUF3952 domain-containing protein [Bacillus thuringiensis]